MANFSELMASAVSFENSLSLNIGDDWLQGRSVYGGLQGALAVKAMRLLVEPGIPLRSLQITFVGPVAAGEVSAEAALLRQGKSASQVSAQIIQNNSVQMFAVGIFASDRQSEAHYDPVMPPSAKSVDEAAEFPYIEGVVPPFFQHFDNRIAEGAALYSGANDAYGKIYARHRNDSACTEEHLVALADVAPPVAMMQLTQPAPGSSMNWQLDFVRTPADLVGADWYRVDADMAATDRGYSWQDTTFWTEKGELAMLSRQCMAVFG